MAVVLVLGGLGVWWLWPDENPLVAVPAKVCERSLPGGALKCLMPERGERFRQRDAYGFAVEGGSRDVVRGQGPGQCLLTGGDVSIRVAYWYLQGGDCTRDDVERDLRKSGGTRLTLGDAGGTLDGLGAHLFVDCPPGKRRDELLEISVGVGGGGADVGDRAVRESAAGFAADAARRVAQDLWWCPGARTCRVVRRASGESGRSAALHARGACRPTPKGRPLKRGAPS